MIRVFLCDDEPLALGRLSNMLTRLDDIEIVGTAGDGQSALDAIEATQPDAVLLDIEMPSLDGFDVIEELARRGMATPLIVFVTAYPQFAAHAFDTGAIDFLTKPVRLGRLETAVERVRRAMADREARDRLAELALQVQTLREERGQDFHIGNYLWVQRRGETVRLDLDLVDWVHAEGEYVRLHIGDASYLHREPISVLLTRLDARRFIRIHRSFIVNHERIQAVRRRATGGYKLVVGDQELPVGRSYRAKLHQIIGGSTAMA